MKKRLWNDSRGAAAWMVTAAMVPVLGFVSLGTEVGSWHVTRRQAQNAADAAAIAGATALLVNDTNGAATAGRAFATSNGFPSASNCPTATSGKTVCITPSGGTGATGTTVTAVVTKWEPPIFTQWFVPAGNVKIQATAVAQIQFKPGYCNLALQSLDISGSSSFSGGCGMASNGTFAPPPPGQNPFLGSPNIWSVSAEGDCTGNANKCNLSGKVGSYRYDTGTPIPLPPALDHLMNGNVVPIEPTGTITNIVGIPSPSTNWQQGYTVPSGGATLAPGLYLFRSLTVNGPLNGTGVNIIIGSGGFDGRGAITMTAGTGGGLSDMNGVLMYDQEGKTASSTPDIKFTGQYTSNFNGAVYFPYAHLTFRGGSGLTGCMVVVAKVLDYGGNSSMDMSGCNNTILSNVVAQSQVVMLTN